MSVWFSYSQPAFIPFPSWWFLVAQKYPNNSPMAELNVYNRSGRDRYQLLSPTTSGQSIRHKHVRPIHKLKYTQHLKNN